MKYQVTRFGITKFVEGYITKNGKKYYDEYYDILMFVERPEDYYALSCDTYRNKYVLVINMKDWRNA